MKYKDIVKGQFVSRPNRFIAHVMVDGAEEICHVKNTGRCKELLVPGCTVYLEDFKDRMGQRKLRYSLIGVEKVKEDSVLMINMDSQAPNKAAKEAFEKEVIKIPDLGKLSYIRPETSFGNSRFDFYFKDENGKEGFAEVKGCTLENDLVASFPDAPTTRGVKHIEELIKAKEEGYSSTILFIIQMKGMKYMIPNDLTHKEFGDALRKAKEKGVNILAYECDITPDTMLVTNKVDVVL